MRLRSGKVLHYEKLPKVLEDELNDYLTQLKTVLIGHEEFGKELLKIISEAYGLGHRFVITQKIEEITDRSDPLDELQILLPLSGQLLMLLTGTSSFYEDNHIKPKFHDIIQERIVHVYDEEVVLMGNELI